MSTVHSVSDITNILSSIIQNPILQDVKVQGEILVDGPPNAFFLRNGGIDLDVSYQVATSVNLNLY